jgi:hypothetical protein
MNILLMGLGEGLDRSAIFLKGMDPRHPPLGRLRPNFMLSDKLTHLKSPPRRKSSVGWYSDNQKLETVKLWLVSGNLQATAAALNIPYPTVRQWRYSKWWEELVTDIRTEGTLKLSNNLKKIAERALGETLERLENGDWVMNQKTGELERKPVAMRDAYQVAAGLLDRHVALDKRPQEDAQAQKVQDRLEALATAFEKFAGKKLPKPEIIDVEPTPKPPEDPSQEKMQEAFKLSVQLEDEFSGSEEKVIQSSEEK